MKIIFFLRGPAGCGKSSWIEENKLEAYTLSSDQFRLEHAGPVVNVEGRYTISRDNEISVWKDLVSKLKHRMSAGEFLIVDATHYKKNDLYKYRKHIIHYGYEAYIVDFTDVPLETVLERNASRSEFRRVPGEVITRMYDIIKNSDAGSLQFISGVISPRRALEIYRRNYEMSLDRYERVVVFGDIHACYEPLKEYFSREPFNDRTAYVFVGDYIDRGLQNAETLEFLLKIYRKDNVFLLEGNHEAYLRDYIFFKLSAIHDLGRAPADYSSLKGRDFVDRTIPAIDHLDINKLKILCNSFIPFLYFTFRRRKYLVTHGGIPAVPATNISVQNYVLGSGTYEEIELMYDAWMKKFPDTVMIHGHRNCYELPTKVHEGIYNLCSDIEFGAPLRILEISAEQGIKTLEIPNPLYDRKLERVDWPTDYLPVNSSCQDKLVADLNSHKSYRKIVLQHGIVLYQKNPNPLYDDYSFGDFRANQIFIDYKTGETVARTGDYVIKENESVLPLRELRKFAEINGIRENQLLKNSILTVNADSCFCADLHHLNSAKNIFYLAYDRFNGRILFFDNFDCRRAYDFAAAEKLIARQHYDAGRIISFLRERNATMIALNHRNCYVDFQNPFVFLFAVGNSYRLEYITGGFS